MTIEVRPLSPALGAEIVGADLTGPIDAATAADVHRAWLDHQVLVFRGQSLDQEDQVRFTTLFGKQGGIQAPGRQIGLDGKPLLPGVMSVSNIRRDGKPLGLAHDGEMWFHSDMCYAERPHKGTFLYAIEIPSVGGNTCFANMYTAYDNLPPEIRERIRGRTALQMHEYLRTDRPRLREDMSGIAHFSHPVAITHPETGRHALYVSRLMTARISGLPEAESDALIDTLLRYAEDPAIVYEHVWRVGDLVMWDNRCVTHARTHFAPTERRLMRRTTVEGERPFEDLPAAVAAEE